MIQKPFDFVKEITLHKSPADSFIEAEWNLFQPFIIGKFLSMNTQLLDIVNYIQMLNISDKKQLYTIYKELIPIDKTYYPFIKKTVTPKENSELVNILKEYFEMSSSEMKEALPLLNKQVITEILQGYGYDDKEIKKLVKNI